ncbi:MAG TPA: uroporphyrinogen-III synthase [Acidimicrobiia bacterium]|nr:uroporphyrinogen-III synthase [Acidimicrobiia bacterium]
MSPDGGLRIGVTAGRRGEELVGALTRLGARVVWGPTVAVVPASGSALEHQTAAVLATRPAWVVVTTAEGLDRWLAGIGPQRPAVVAALAGAGVAARGAKAAAACRRHGLRSVLTSPAERGVELARLVAARARPGDRVTVLADGNGSPAVRAELAAAGLAVDVVAPYRWTVPAAAGPEAGGCVPPGDLLRELCAGRLDAMAFTSPPAVDGLFAVAAALGIEPAVQAALAGTGTGDGRRILVAAIGPATAEALEERSVGVGVCPLQPRMAALAGALAAAPLRVSSFAGPGRLTLDARTRTVTGEAGAVALSDLQYALVASMARRPGMTCPTGVLLREVWGAGAGPAAGRRRLEVLVSRLRSRLAAIDVNLVTVPKRGYRLELAAPAGVAAPVSRGGTAVG